MREFQGKKTLITGAASGIGRALAVKLAAAGADLFLVDIDEPSLNETAHEIRKSGVPVMTRCCDLSITDEVCACVQQLLATWGTLDILVNNAGVSYYGSTARMSASQWDWVMSVNLLAPVRLVHELLPTLLARPEAHIVNISSIYGITTTARCCAYHVSKFGLIGLSEALRTEFGRQGLGVTAVCPGFVRTNLFSSMACADEKSRRQPPRWLSTTPERVAEKTIRAIRRDKRLVLVSAMAYVLYYLKRFTPGLLDIFSRIGRRGKMKRKALELTALPQSDLSDSETDTRHEDEAA